MKQKYRPLSCSVSNLKFQVVHKGKSYNQNKQRTDNYATCTVPRNRSLHTYMESFIPATQPHSKKQIVQTFTMFRKQVKPLLGHEIQHKGFPVRRIRTSQSVKNMSQLKKQKNFNLGNSELPVFTNPKLILLMKSERVQISDKQKHQSAFDNYNSLKEPQTQNGWRIRQTQPF